MKTQRFDMTEWQEIDCGVKEILPKGRLRLRASAPVAVYCYDESDKEGRGVLAATGDEVELIYALDGPYAFEVIPREAGTRVFMYWPQLDLFGPTGEVFTNADRMIHESGSMYEVKRAMRHLQLEQRRIVAEAKAEIRRERDKVAAPEEKREEKPEERPEEKPEEQPEVKVD